MPLCRGDTIDIPDSLLKRAKDHMLEQKTTFRALVISSLERSLAQSDQKELRLRDAAVGKRAQDTVSNQTINQSIDEQRDPSFQS